jgi:hypothetical protein
MSTVVWRVAAASVCGASHERTGQPCQDAQNSVVLPDGTLIAAVADGAGSARLAEVGAAVAVRAAIEFFSAGPAEWHGHPARESENATTERMGETPMPLGATAAQPDDEQHKAWLTKAVAAARAAVVAEAAARGAEPRDLASTLIVLLARPGLVAAAQIGDGAVVVAEGGEGLCAITKPSSGEFLNETTFLTSPNADEQLQLAFWRGAVAHLAAFTDGLQMLALQMPGGAPHAPFFAPLFRFLAGQSDEAQARDGLTGFLRSPRLRERADDDLTLLLATRVE